MEVDVAVVVVERVEVVLPEPALGQVSPKLKERVAAVGAGVKVRRAATVSLRRALATSCGELTVADLAEAVREELDVVADRAAEPFALMKRFDWASKVSLELLPALFAEEKRVRETCAGLATETREFCSALAGADFSVLH